MYRYFVLVLLGMLCECGSSVLSAQAVKLMTPNVRLLQTARLEKCSPFSLPGRLGKKKCNFVLAALVNSLSLFSTHHLGRSLFAVREVLCDWSEMLSGHGEDTLCFPLVKRLNSNDGSFRLLQWLVGNIR